MIKTPLPDMVCVREDADAPELLELVRASGFSKLPVRAIDGDEVCGWVDARDVFVEGGEGTVRRWVRRPLFVSELDRVDQVLARMQERGERLAVVVDERGTTAGMLTSWDVIARIFGDIGDEDQAEREAHEPVRRLERGAYLLAGRVSVREWRDIFGVAAKLPATATVGGLVTALLGRPARVGDVVRLDNLEMEVREVGGRRVRLIELRLRDAPGAEEGAA